MSPTNRLLRSPRSGRLEGRERRAAAADERPSDAPPALLMTPVTPMTRQLIRNASIVNGDGRTPPFPATC